MSKVLLIDVDSKIPNLALMQISSWHKSQGDLVGFNIPDPDIVYSSVIFTKNKHLTDGLHHLYPDAQINKGGSGQNHNWLPPEMQKIKPDYDLYQMDYSLGFTTRGCIRNCPFCLVREKEGNYKRWMHISEFHNSQFKIVQLLDNNWFAEKNWFFENSNYLIENDLKLKENGMDIRLLDSEIAEQLSRIKWSGKMHFAWDNMGDEPFIVDGLQLLKEHDINIRGSVLVYVLVDFNTTFEQDLYRCQVLKELGTNPFIMPYEPPTWDHPEKLRNPHVPYLARWANRKETFWTCNFKDYRWGGWKPPRISDQQSKLAFADVEGIRNGRVK